MGTDTASSCCSSAAPSGSVAHFHISLNVANLVRSVGFFRAFFGCEPAKLRPDYAKFELADPPLVLSLEPFRAPPGGNLNHLGFRMPDSQALVDVQRRLEMAGISTRRENGVECCYSRQTKFWVDDPDGNLWEVYTFEEDLEHRGNGPLPVLPQSAANSDGPPEAMWAHWLGEPFAARLPILDGTVDRVVLEGTLNESLADGEIPRRLREVQRVLKPGGIVHLHMLTANQPLNDEPLRLPGPAALVSAVPVERHVLEQLQQAGLENARLVFHAPSACFHACGAELRETRIEARRS